MAAATPTVWGAAPGERKAVRFAASLEVGPAAGRLSPRSQANSILKRRAAKAAAGATATHAGGWSAAIGPVEAVGALRGAIRREGALRREHVAEMRARLQGKPPPAAAPFEGRAEAALRAARVVPSGAVGGGEAGAAAEGGAQAAEQPQPGGEAPQVARREEMVAPAHVLLPVLLPAPELTTASVPAAEGPPLQASAACGTRTDAVLGEQEVDGRLVQEPHEALVLAPQQPQQQPLDAPPQPFAEECDDDVLGTKDAPPAQCVEYGAGQQEAPPLPLPLLLPTSQRSSQPRAQQQYEEMLDWAAPEVPEVLHPNEGGDASALRAVADAFLEAAESPRYDLPAVQPTVAEAVAEKAETQEDALRQLAQAMEALADERRGERENPLREPAPQPAESAPRASRTSGTQTKRAIVLRRPPLAALRAARERAAECEAQQRRRAERGLDAPSVSRGQRAARTRVAGRRAAPPSPTRHATQTAPQALIKTEALQAERVAQAEALLGPPLPPPPPPPLSEGAKRLRAAKVLLEATQREQRATEAQHALRAVELRAQMREHDAEDAARKAAGRARRQGGGGFSTGRSCGGSCGGVATQTCDAWRGTAFKLTMLRELLRRHLLKLGLLALCHHADQKKLLRSLVGRARARAGPESARQTLAAWRAVVQTRAIGHRRLAVAASGHRLAEALQRWRQATLRARALAAKTQLARKNAASALCKAAFAHWEMLWLWQHAASSAVRGSASWRRTRLAWVALRGWRSLCESSKNSDDGGVPAPVQASLRTYATSLSLAKAALRRCALARKRRRFSSTTGASPVPSPLRDVGRRGVLSELRVAMRERVRRAEEARAEMHDINMRLAHAADTGAAAGAAAGTANASTSPIQVVVGGAGATSSSRRDMDEAPLMIYTDGSPGAQAAVEVAAAVAEGRLDALAGPRAALAGRLDRADAIVTGRIVAPAPLCEGQGPALVAPIAPPVEAQNAAATAAAAAVAGVVAGSDAAERAAREAARALTEQLAVTRAPPAPEATASINVSLSEEAAEALRRAEAAAAEAKAAAQEAAAGAHAAAREAAAATEAAVAATAAPEPLPPVAMPFAFTASEAKGASPAPSPSLRAAERRPAGAARERGLTLAERWRTQSEGALGIKRPRVLAANEIEQARRQRTGINAEDEGGVVGDAPSAAAAVAVLHEASPRPPARDVSPALSMRSQQCSDDGDDGVLVGDTSPRRRSRSPVSSEIPVTRTPSPLASPLRSPRGPRAHSPAGDAPATRALTSQPSPQQSSPRTSPRRGRSPTRRRAPRVVPDALHTASPRPAEALQAAQSHGTLLPVEPTIAAAEALAAAAAAAAEARARKAHALQTIREEHAAAVETLRRQREDGRALRVARLAGQRWRLYARERVDARRGATLWEALVARRALNCWRRRRQRSAAMMRAADEVELRARRAMRLSAMAVWRSRAADAREMAQAAAVAAAHSRRHALARALVALRHHAASRAVKARVSARATGHWRRTALRRCLTVMAVTAAEARRERVATGVARSHRTRAVLARWRRWARQGVVWRARLARLGQQAEAMAARAVLCRAWHRLAPRAARRALLRRVLERGEARWEARLALLHATPALAFARMRRGVAAFRAQRDGARAARTKAAHVYTAAAHHRSRVLCVCFWAWATYFDNADDNYLSGEGDVADVDDLGGVLLLEDALPAAVAQPELCAIPSEPDAAAGCESGAAEALMLAASLNRPARVAGSEAADGQQRPSIPYHDRRPVHQQKPAGAGAHTAAAAEQSLLARPPGSLLARLTPYDSAHRADDLRVAEKLAEAAHAARTRRVRAYEAAEEMLRIRARAVGLGGKVCDPPPLEQSSIAQAAARALYPAPPSAAAAAFGRRAGETLRAMATQSH